MGSNGRLDGSFIRLCRNTLLLVIIPADILLLFALGIFDFIL